MRPEKSPKKSKELNDMAECVFPEDIIICILTRLPVKSIIRFKSVCKPWRELLSTTEFIKLHHSQFSSDPKNQSFLVHRIDRNDSNTVSLFNIDPNEKKPTFLDHPVAYTRTQIDIVGCCHGLVCICRIHEIVLWNPATKLSKSVSPCCLQWGVSLGFGYDAVGSDFKVVRIICSGMKVIEVNVYSVNSDSWVTINVDFQFGEFRNKCDVIVNGNPYWLLKVDENEVLVRFDVIEVGFKIVPLSTLCHGEGTTKIMIDWNGSLGALVSTVKNKLVESLEVWVFDDCEQIWRKNHTFWPIEVYVDRALQCSKNGKVLGVRPNGKLCVFDPETGWVKGFYYDVRKSRLVEVFGYTESLSSIRRN